MRKRLQAVKVTSTPKHNDALAGENFGKPKFKSATAPKVKIMLLLDGIVSPKREYVRPEGQRITAVTYYPNASRTRTPKAVKLGMNSGYVFRDAHGNVIGKAKITQNKIW
jgi:hypothetical protein